LHTHAAKCPVTNTFFFLFPTVAHRINTILDSDRIVVLDKGEVKEFDTPQALVKSKGLFYELVRESGLLGSVEML
jgi:ATP-binding cassette subfamily C (CFTR/MRP) protein 1